MSELESPSNDDWGGRVCRQCNTPIDGYISTLYAYSAYTKRDAFRGDSLFLAAHTDDDELVTVEFTRVPYRLYLQHESAKACMDGIYGRNLQSTIEHYAEFRVCTRRIDSRGEERKLVELRFRSRKWYMEVYQHLKCKSITVFIDSAHDALQGLDALLNLGIPGAPVALRLKPSAGTLVDSSRWRIDSPTSVCVHGVKPRFPSNLTEVAIGVGPDKSICVGYRDQMAWFGEKEGKAFEKQMSKIRPTVIVLRDRDTTMRQLHDFVKTFFFNLFSVTPLCPPRLPSRDQPLLHGLGVLIFDVATIPRTTLQLRPCQWLDAYRSNRCMEDRWMQAMSSHTNTNHLPSPYNTFSAIMVLHYARNSMVCELTTEAHTSYNGGEVIFPKPSFVLLRPVALFDFQSHYPSIANAINAGKDTYVSRDGEWDLGTFGGFTTCRRGSLAEALKEQLEERMRIVNDPTMETRAAFLKQKINNMVGMCGHKWHPYADTRVAGCITAAGRRLLQACHRHVSDVTLAGYTDSLFIELPIPVPSYDQHDSLQCWLSRPILEEYTTRFASVIGKEMQSMASAPSTHEKPLIRFRCQQITMAALFTAAAHAHVTGYLISDTTDGNPRVDIQMKGGFKSQDMQCVRLFNDALVRISIAGEFLIGGSQDFWSGDIRALERTLPKQILTHTGWKTAVKIEFSPGSDGILQAAIYFADGSESRHSFLSRVDGEGLVDVTHITSAESASACLTRRRESCIVMAELFCRRLCRSLLPLDAYVIDGANRVLVKVRQQTSKKVPLSHAARNGFALDLKEYHRRWMGSCIDTLKCASCQCPLKDSTQCCYAGNGIEEHGLFHRACNPEGQPLDRVRSSAVSNFITTAISTILVSGTNTAAEALSCLIELSDNLKSIVAKEEPPSRPYDRVLDELKRGTPSLIASKEYRGTAIAFACIPDTSGTWLCIESDHVSISVLRLLFEAMRVQIRHGKYENDRAVLEAVSSYPAERLRFTPPPILKAKGEAPIQAWQDVMDELAKTPEDPVLTKIAPFKCQMCERVLGLGIGDCCHLACTFCSRAWNTCATCQSAWKMSHLDKSTQMNYHPLIFPFEEWYEYLPVTGWYVYCGPEELLYDSSTRHIIALATGGTAD